MPNNTTNHFGRRTINGQTALGTNQATAFELENSADYEFTTVASSTGAILPLAKLPTSIAIWNGGSNALSVYPPLGGTVNGGSTNAAYALAAGSGVTFFASDLLVWYMPAATSGGVGTVTSVATGTGLTGGPITGTGTVSLATIADKSVLGNTSGGTAVPAGVTLSAMIDEAIGNTQGNVLYRGASVWAVLAPGTSGQSLQTQGASANPQWAEPTGPRPFIALLGLGTNIATGTNIPGTYSICSFSGTFTRWDVAIPSANQPSGASLVIDVLKSSNQGSTWISLWATNTGNRPTVTSGTNSGGGTAFDTTTFSAGDWLRYDVITAGGGAVQYVSLAISSRMNQ